MFEATTGEGGGEETAAASADTEQSEELSGLNLPGIVLALLSNGNKEMFTYLFFEDDSGFLHVQRKG